MSSTLPDEQIKPPDRANSVLQHFTVLMLMAAVFLFVIGKLSQYYMLQDLGINALRLDTPWQDLVFWGGIAVLNTCVNLIDAPSTLLSAWFFALVMLMLAFQGLQWIRTRIVLSAKLRLSRFLLIALMVVCTVIIITNVAMRNGELSAKMYRQDQSRVDKFSFHTTVVENLPEQLRLDNDKERLKVILRTEQFFIVLSADRNTVFQINNDDVSVYQSYPRTTLLKEPK